LSRAQKLLDLIHPLLGEVEVQLKALVRFLCSANAVGFIGGKKIALRPGTGDVSDATIATLSKNRMRGPPTSSFYSKSR
jgi:hypothetical protein